ncbi:hypothetical protein [Halostella litorea]|uniref:hypothetical protein n=1 Tax=Halostella litorea TaxID=2528831 RepID=UPI0010925403|nr:hypothetical protein [Halostella litorea]
MPAGPTLFALAVVFAVVAPLVLYALVSAEADDTERVDRSTAQRRARRDDGGSEERHGADDDPWGRRDDGDENGRP